MLLIGAARAPAAPEIQLYLNGQPVAFDVVPQTVNSRVLVPLRGIFEALGARVAWYPTLSKAVFRWHLLDLHLEIGKKEFVLGGRRYQMDVAPYIEKGRTMVPLRLVSEVLLDADVRWDSHRKAVFIDLPPAPEVREIPPGLAAALAAAGAGDLVNIEDFPIMFLPEIRPQRRDGGGSLLFSDSPEYVDRPGILYKGTATGPVRLYYYHVNELERPARVAVIAENTGSERARFTLYRQVTAAGGDWIRLGRKVVAGYLEEEEGKPAPKPVAEYTLAPGERVWLNQGPEFAPAPPGQLLHGILEGKAGGALTFSFIILPEGEDPLAPDLPLEYLEPVRVHDRGTFPADSRHLTVKAGSLGAVMLADWFSDPFLSGRDEVKGLPATLIGNYGLTYRLRVEFERPAFLLWAPVGGPHQGAVWVNGNVIQAPREYVEPYRQAVFLGLYPAGGRAEIRWMPPGGSWMPVELVIIPEK